jgi:hypothetical protein
MVSCCENTEKGSISSKDSKNDFINLFKLVPQ